MRRKDDYSTKRVGVHLEPEHQKAVDVMIELPEVKRSHGRRKPSQSSVIRYCLEQTLKKLSPPNHQVLFPSLSDIPLQKNLPLDDVNKGNNPRKSGSNFYIITNSYQDHEVIK